MTKRQLQEEKYDWHLPSKEVLNAMYENRKRIGGFASSYYWSSSEYSSTSAWEQFFTNGLKGSNVKTYLNRVRLVRALPEGHNETERLFQVGNQDYQAYPKDAPEEMDWDDAMML